MQGSLQSMETVGFPELQSCGSGPQLRVTNRPPTQSARPCFEQRGRRVSELIGRDLKHGRNRTPRASQYRGD